MARGIESARRFHVLLPLFINRLRSYPDGTQVERTYTNRSQLNQIKYNGSVIDTRVYDLGERLSTSTYSNGAVTTWNYRVSGANKDNLLANITTTNPGANKVGTYTYIWDANRNKTAETISNSPISGYGFSTGAAGYDFEDRVTAWNRSDSNQNQTWNLSLVGDWNTFNQTGTGPFNQTRTHGPAHEFTSFTGTSSGTLTFDTKGNLITRPATLAVPALNLTWDIDNRMSGADTDGTPATNEVTFQYDALGRRVARTESGITTIFVQAGQQTIADYVSGAVPSSPIYRYVYGDYIDEPVMRETASGNVKHFYHRNQQYSITALTDNNGNTAERYAYTANGVLTIFNATGTQIPTSALSNRYTYTGREWDSATTLYHFRARTYDPKLGRFISRDPLSYVDGMSLYRGYFGLGGMDPFGKTICKCVSTTWGSSSGGGGASDRTYFQATSGQCSELNSDSSKSFAGVGGGVITECSSSSLTEDEKQVSRLCEAIPTELDSNNDEVPDRDECEERIAWLMNIVSTTTMDGQEEARCFGYMRGIRAKCGCEKNKPKFSLSPGCEITFYMATPNPVGSVLVRGDFRGYDGNGRPLYFPPRYYRRTGFRAGFYEHSFARLCCGTGADQKCMYFDVGSQNRAGNFGGDDNWFDEQDDDFIDDLDQTTIEEDNFAR